MVTPFLIGVSADLSDNGSIHTKTFKRAVKDAIEDIRQSGGAPDIVWESDFATPEGGRAAAEKLVKHQVDIVVGHYATGAAQEALAIYADKGIPLLLPAATADNLTIDYKEAFRLCSPDSSLVKVIVEEVIDSFPTATLYIGGDLSVHGKHMADQLAREFHKQHTLFTNQPSEANLCLFAGRFNTSIEFVRSIEDMSRPHTVLLTDDAVHPGLPQGLGTTSKDILVAGFEPSAWCTPAAEVVSRYSSRYNEGSPGTYYLETYTGIQIATALAGMSVNRRNIIQLLGSTSWDTVLGRVSFDDAGELGLNRYALYRIQEGVLAPVKELVSSNISL
jgi:ABC-type branched-subunit amino acid transport system substrate-binding protein